MKQKILYLLLFMFSITYAQIPTNGLQAMYEFTNGSLVDAANSNNFTQTGTALTQVNDRLNNTTKAISLNGDHLTRANLTGNEMTYSFWIKTTTNAPLLQTIIDDSQKNGGHNNFTGTQKGCTIMLGNGKITADVRMQHRARFTNLQAYSSRNAASSFIADGNWHHIVVRFKAYKGSGTNYYGLVSIHVDGSLSNENNSLLTNAGTTPFFDTTGNVAVGTNRNNTIPSNLKYNDAIDDILVYNRALTAQEILNIRNVGGYCTPPSNSVVSSTTITETSIALATPATEHEVAYHKSSEPFSNATIITQVFNNTTINGLDSSTPYRFYVRTPCAATGTSGWSSAKTIRTAGTIYVNHAATGNNDGSSWANAYTDLRSSIFLSNSDKPIWVAGGIYKPHASIRTVYFHVNTENVKIYGGFAGTETSISQRIVGANETILSGDLQGNDANLADYVSNYYNPTRNADNSYHVINITATGNNLLLDGLTISDAHNNLNGTERGGAIIKDKTVAKLTVRNCIIKNNLSRNDNAGLIAEFELNNTSGARGALVIENSKFINNMSRWGSGVYSFVRANTNVDISVTNSLFDTNLTGDLNNTSAKGISGSASWFRVIANGSNATLNLTNNTYVNNIDIGTKSVNNLTRAVVAISKPQGFSSVFNAQVNNCIFWSNIGPGGVTTRSITDLDKVPANSLIINNSIDELNFNDDSITSKTSTTNSDPLFTSATDFTLQSGSPAKDTGDNAKAIGNTDLLGNNRIFNTTVDIGAYEFGSPVYVERTLTINATNGTVATNPNPNGNGAYADGTSVELTATPDTGYQFDSFTVVNTGAGFGLTSSLNPLNITMDADKTVTANFSPIRHTLTISETNTTVTASPSPVNGTYADGTVITLTAAPDANHEFRRWNRTGFASNSTNPLVITLNSDETIYAISDAIIRTLNVSTTNNGSLRDGNVTEGTNTNNITQAQYINSTNVTLTATPRTSNYEFLRWTGDVTSTANPLSLTMDSDKTILANFGLIQKTLTVNATNGSVTTNPNPTGGTYDINSIVILTAVPDAGYQFDGWSGNATGTTNPLNIAMDVDKTITATFSLIPAPLPTFINSPTNISGAYTATINFSSAVTGFDMSDIQVTGATLSNFTAVSGTEYTVVVTPTSICNTTVTLQVPANVSQDASNVNNTASTTATINAVDNVNPTVVAQNFTLQLDASGQGTLTVANIDNGSSDNCAIATSVLDKTSFDCSNLGANTVKLTVTDASNNSSDTTVTVTVEDKIAPTVVAKNITVQLGTNGIVNIIAADVYNSTSDNCSVTSVSADKTNFTCNDLGANNVLLTVEDTSGNTNTATAVVTVNQNPNAQLAAVTQDITVQLDANGNATITPAQVDNGSGSGCNSNPTLSLDKTSFTCADLGINTVTLTATDSGNSVSNTATITVEDNIDPTVVAQDFTLQLDANGQGTLTVANIDNGSSDNCNIESIILDKTNFDCSNIGANAVKLTVTDASGNSSDASVTVTVEDKIAPTVITQDIAVQLGAGGQVTITPQQINNGSSDNCTTTANLTYSLNTTTFSCSEVGTNNVVLTVTDTSGNSATASAVVTVSEDPNLSLSTVTQDITVQLDANGSVTITPSQVDNGSGSGCNSNPTLTLDIATFDCSNIGANTVTLTANDGTTSITATATVTVEDKAAPTVTTQDVTVTLDASGQGSITIAEIDNGSTDNCGIDTRTLDVTSFTCADLGTNTVTLTIVDSSGNSANATATVTVVETVAPTVITQNITAAIDADGNLSITPQQIDNGSTDTCSGIASMTLDQNSFSCPTLGDVTVTLTVTDVSGNSATKTAIVTITGPDEDNDGISDACDSKEIILSKGFSPNGDGQNDTWVVENIDNYPNNKVEIFNRWGERMYQANNYQNDWDAKSNQRGGSNEKLPVGSYYYIINLNEPGISPIQGWLYINY